MTDLTVDMPVPTNEAGIYCPPSSASVGAVAAIIGSVSDVVHQRTRLGLLSELYIVGKSEFGGLAVSTGVSAPDLSHHLAVLEGAGLVTITKGYVGRRPRTWAELTVLGGQALEGEIEVLRSLVRFADTAGADAQATLGAIS